MTTTYISPPAQAAPTGTRSRTEVSRHITSEGTVIWSRCTCGRLQMLLHRGGASLPATVAGGSTPGCPDCF